MKKLLSNLLFDVLFLVKYRHIYLQYSTINLRRSSFILILFPKVGGNYFPTFRTCSELESDNFVEQHYRGGNSEGFVRIKEEKASIHIFGCFS